MLLRAISSGEFMVSLHVMEDICGLLLPLSKALQSSTADLSAGMRLVDIVDVLEQRRQNAENGFNVIYSKVAALSQEFDVQIQLPRRVGRQTNRENYPTVQHLILKFISHKVCICYRSTTC